MGNYSEAGCTRKKLQLTATHPLHVGEQLISDLIRSKCEVTPIGWSFFVQPIAAQCPEEGGVAKFENSWEKHNIA